MEKIEIAGLKINTLTKQEILTIIRDRMIVNKKTWVTTVYSEFLYAALTDPEVMQLLNNADIAVPDGIGIFWARKYLSLPLTAKSYYEKILQSFWQVVYSLVMMLGYPKWAYNYNLSLNPSPQKERERLQTADASAVTPPPAGVPHSSAWQEWGGLRGGAGERLQERIPGSELIWDIARLAADNNFSIYLLGGFGDTPKLVAEKLSPSKTHGREFDKALRVAGFSSKDPQDTSTIEDINKTRADILLVAYGPIKQEQWIAENLEKLPSVKLAIGLGGTFDYVAGKRIQPPSFVRKIGLEWLFRLFTQPYRYKRIFNAFFGLINKMVIYKIYQTLPLRKNAASVILNKDKNILIVRRNPNPKQEEIMGDNKKKYANYWQLPQGGIDPNEDIVAGALRENMEELQIKSLDHIYTSPHTHSYNFSLGWGRIFNKNYRFRGQKQNIIYFNFTGAENEIKPDQIELIDYKWVHQNQLLKSTHPERHSLLTIVMGDLSNII